MKLKMTLIGVFFLAIMAGQLTAQSSPGDEFFEKKIRPVLVDNCYGCHSSKLKNPMGGLVLDSRSGLLRGGVSGPVIVFGKPLESLLIRALRYSDLRLKMPPTGRLPDSVISDFEEWIAAGAPDPRIEPSSSTPAGEAPSDHPNERGIDFDQGRKWWSFQPVRALTAPRVKQASWPQRKIDHFVLASLEKNGLSPSAKEDPRTLIRRVYLDLIGLKPTYAEVERFANDTSPTRYQKLVDHLLASPRYGERWGRYWLDVARYAENGDTGGNRQSYLYAWRYRDWVIDAMNRDLPYDLFIKQQLAADHLPGTSRSDLRALGYLGIAPSEWKEKMLGKELIDNLLLEEWDERVDAVGRGFLGLTVACARCHDHKFDPISTKDYYAMAGVFASTSPAIRPLREIDSATESRFLFARQRVTELASFVNFLSKTPEPEREAALKQAEVCRAEMALLKAEMNSLRERYPELAQAVAKIGVPKEDGDAETAKKPEEDLRAPFINAVHDAAMWSDGSHADFTEIVSKPGETRNLPVFARGNSTSPGEIVPRRFLTVLARNADEVFQRGSGRLELAERILTDAAPLSARVIVNRVWGWHFGKHLVETPSDFGNRGEQPSHPELLEDLSARFIANGWSLKWLHREIVLSAAYRQSSRPRTDGLRIDATNRLLWRMNPRRLDAEAYRDTLLQAAGLLNLEMNGPSLDIDALDNNRRTVYGRINRGRMSDFLRLYDFPNPFQHSPGRSLTITPLQELFVLNSPFMKQVSVAVARSVEQDAEGVSRVRGLYRMILSRDPSPSEITAGVSYLNSATVERFAQVLLATNEKAFWP